jgi:hypothetical protein
LAMADVLLIPLISKADFVQQMDREPSLSF